ncbi:MAG: hypothetical protein DRJ42_09010 [Deltaproteobacteria bacterium]|nr:MAG: hypothetical protein DRJ42_09010 [Deltaproteobacteria bacterium]
MTLNRYRPVRRLAKGPTTESFLAQQVGMAGLERLVVVRRLRRELINDGHYIQLFLEGTRQAGQLRHPNVVETLEVGQEGEVYFLVTEYLSAEELLFISRDIRKQEGQIPTAVVCQMIHDVASALSYAHEATDLDGQPLGIVHAEVSPQQILVSYEGLTKLDGFGLAKANTHHVYARPDDMRVKLAYAAPERVRYEDVFPATDVFSLGVIMHELLTGQRLFRGKTPSDVIKAVMEQEIVPPSQVLKGVPKELDSVVMRAVERDLDKRTATAEDFINELRHATQELGIVAGSEDVGEWMRASFDEAHERRLAVEGQVAQEVMAGDLGDHSDVAPMFTSPGAISAFSDVGSTGMGSVPSGLVMHEKKPSMLPWIVVGVIAVLLIVGTAFFLGSFGEAPPPVAGPEPEIPGIIVHTSPEGTTVQVDGALVAQQVGPDGVFIARGEAEVVTVEVALEGYETVRQTVQMPAEGRRELQLVLEEVTEDLLYAAADEIVPDEAAEHTGDGGVAPVAAAMGGRRFVPRRGMGGQRGASAAAASTGRSGRLVIYYSPSSANIAVDGVTIAGSSPVTVSDLSPGTHTVRASASGFSTSTREATVEANGSRDVRLELAPGAPRTATLNIVTTPSGAQILVNGRSRGTSPLMNIELEPNREYRISASLQGYRPWSARVTPVAGRNPALMASLQAAPQAVAAVAAAAPSQPARRGDIRVPSGMSGSASSGRSLANSRCGRCHGSTAGALNPRRYTQSQWTRYFATGRHGRRAMLGQSFSVGQLADVKAYLVANAADVQSDTAAGVR